MSMVMYGHVTLVTTSLAATSKSHGLSSDQCLTQ